MNERKQKPNKARVGRGGGVKEKGGKAFPLVTFLPVLALSPRTDRQTLEWNEHLNSVLDDTAFSMHHDPDLRDSPEHTD